MITSNKSDQQSWIKINDNCPIDCQAKTADPIGDLLDVIVEELSAQPELGGDSKEVVGRALCDIIKQAGGRIPSALQSQREDIGQNALLGIWKALPLVTAKPDAERKPFLGGIIFRQLGYAICKGWHEIYRQRRDELADSDLEPISQADWKRFIRKLAVDGPTHEELQALVADLAKAGKLIGAALADAVADYFAAKGHPALQIPSAPAKLSKRTRQRREKEGRDKFKKWMGPEPGI